MDKSKLVEDLITTRLLNGEVMEFVTELKQADVTSTEAKTADLFGDPRVGELVGNVIDNIDNQESLTPAITELREYLDKSDKNASNVGGVKENFAMENTKVENEIQKNVDENVIDGKELDVKSIMERMGKLEDAVAQFSEMKDQITKMAEFMFAESKSEEDPEEELEEDEEKEVMDDDNFCDSKVSFSEDGSVTINMSKETYNKLRDSMANIRNFAEESEDEETIAIPKSEYKQLMYDLGKAEARADIDSAKAFEEAPAEVKEEEEKEAEVDHAEVDETPDDIKAMKAEIAELKAALESLKSEEKKVEDAEASEEDHAETSGAEVAPVAETPKGVTPSGKTGLSDEEKEALKEEIKEDVKEDLIQMESAKPESLSADEKSAVERNFSEAESVNDTFDWLFG